MDAVSRRSIQVEKAVWAGADPERPGKRERIACAAAISIRSYDKGLGYR